MENSPSEPAAEEVSAVPSSVIGTAASAVVNAPDEMRRLAFLISLGWLGTNLGLAISKLPLQFLLKESLGMTAAGVSMFFAIGEFTNYIKPVAGLLCDSVPLFRTRRRWYLLLSLLGTGVGWLLMNVVPRTYNSLLVTYSALYLTVVFTSTSLGGVMVAAGMRFGAAGRLTAQRIGMFRLGVLLGGPLAGYLAERHLFAQAMGMAALLHLILVPLFYFHLHEPPTARLNRRVWEEAGAQFRLLLRSHTLLSAAGMTFLVAASPGFGTPLLFYQTDTLHFSKQFIGNLAPIGAAAGLAGAGFYYAVCRTLSLRMLLGGSIVVHALGTLFYLGYHTPASAIAITALSGLTVTLATLPIYDLAIRATPRGCEALGYSLMMSVWNLTNALSDVSGSWLFNHFRLTFISLVWLNAGTTALVLVAVPLLPAALMQNRDGVTPTA